MKSVNKLKIFQLVRPPSCFEIPMFITHLYAVALVVEVLFMELYDVILFLKKLRSINKLTSFYKFKLL